MKIETAPCFTIHGWPRVNSRNLANGSRRYIAWRTPVVVAWTRSEAVVQRHRAIRHAAAVILEITDAAQRMMAFFITNRKGASCLPC